MVWHCSVRWLSLVVKGSDDPALQCQTVVTGCQRLWRSGIAVSDGCRWLSKALTIQCCSVRQLLLVVTASDGLASQCQTVVAGCRSLWQSSVAVSDSCRWLSKALTIQCHSVRWLSLVVTASDGPVSQCEMVVAGCCSLWQSGVAVSDGCCWLSRPLMVQHYSVRWLSLVVKSNTLTLHSFVFKSQGLLASILIYASLCTVLIIAMTTEAFTEFMWHFLHFILCDKSPMT